MEDGGPGPSCSKNVQISSTPPADENDLLTRFQEMCLIRRPPSQSPALIPDDPPSTPRERRRGELLHQCLPISCMKLFDGYLLVMSEGPCLLVFHPKLKLFKHKDHEKCRRIQIFPNQLTITGIEFVEDSCGYPARNSPWDGPDEDHSLAFVWAGNHGIFVTLNRKTLQIDEMDKFPMNEDGYLALNYIPIAARWFENGRILVLLSVFNYIVIYERTSTAEGIRGLQEIGKYECEPENLYSGTMDGEELNDIIVFSGTTFKGILIWEIWDGKVNIRHKLTGHQGIPFSLDYNCDWKMLLSASDDRTVIAWSFSEEKEASYIPDLPLDIDDGFLIARKMEKKKRIPPVAKITHRLRGHEARVWKSIWVKRAGFVLMVSVGEDSWVRMTSFDRMAEKFWKAHDGASIYQCAYDQDDDHLYTAAHDGSIFRWKRFYLKTQPKMLIFDQIPKDPRTDGMYLANKYNRSLINHDYPRGLALWDSNYVIASMDLGRILAFYYFNNKQFHLIYDPRFKHYSVLSVSPHKSMIAVGGLQGDFIILQVFLEERPYSDCQVMSAKKAFDFQFETKVLNMIWVTNSQLFIVCLDKAYLLHLFYKDSKHNEICGEILNFFPLSLERPGIPSAIQMNSKFIVCGDESGSLMLFHFGTTSRCLDLLQTIDKVHAEGVTSIVEYKSKIMTAGKFGGVKSFILEGTDLETRLVKVHEFTTPFDWIGRLLPIQDRHEDLLIGGFYKKDFIIYSWKEKRILNEISGVGGGNRRWDFKFGYGNAAFAFVRDKEIYHSTTSIEDREDNILKHGLHHKTINCGIILLKREGSLLLATGSDDGTIRIFRYDLKRNTYFPIHKINSHASSVRTLASMKIDEDRSLLFSGGGRSEVFASLIGHHDAEELELYGKITLVKSKNRDAETDTRVMDLVVTEFQNPLKKKGIVCFCACSDGSVRALIFSVQKKKFSIASLFDANNHAVMKIEYIRRDNYILLFGSTSNGYLLIWKWMFPTDIDFKFNAKPEVLQPIYYKCIRKAAVMSLKIVRNLKKSDKLNDEHLMAVGSDDCCVSLWKLRIPKDKTSFKDIEVEEMWHEDQTQRGAVIGVEIVDNLVFSCSNDQVIAKFDLEGNLIGKSLAGVPDCQGFIVSHLDDCITCFGDGVTWISSP